MILYLCNCGCTNDRDGMIKVWHDQHTKVKLRCIKHKKTLRGNIKKRFNICKICNEQFEVKVSGRAKDKCNKCSQKSQPRDKVTIDCFQILKDSDVTPIPGEVINIYECGCIVPNKYDANKLKYVTKLGKSARVCPFHAHPRILIGKFKICKTCGATQQGWNIQSSQHCKYCPKYQIAKSRSRSKYYNLEKQDLDR